MSNVHCLFTEHNAETALLMQPDTSQHISYSGGQLLQTEGLRQKIDAAVAVEPLTERIFRISRNKDNFHLRVKFSALADKARRVHAWHNNVGDQQIDRFLGVANQIKRRITAFSLYNL